MSIQSMLQLLIMQRCCFITLYNPPKSQDIHAVFPKNADCQKAASAMLWTYCTLPALLSACLYLVHISQKSLSRREGYNFPRSLVCTIGVGSAQAGDAVELTETRSLTAAVDQAMVGEPPDQELAGSPRDMDYDAGQQGAEGSSPISDENNTDFAAVHSVLSAIDARDQSSD